MNKLALLLLALPLAACGAKNTGVVTTPTYQAARWTPPPVVARRELAPTPGRTGGRGLRGKKAVLAASGSRYPRGDEMQGGTWIVEDANSYDRFVFYTRRDWVGYVVVPEGEQLRNAFSGNIDLFNVSGAYCDGRPCVMISPKGGRIAGNIQIPTTGGIYNIEPRFADQPMAGIELRKPGRRLTAAQPSYLPQPEGQQTPLAFLPDCGDADRLPAWLSGASAYADERKTVITFVGQQAPGLYAGQAGEQVVNYTTRREGGLTHLVTDRRVTEAQLKLGSECVGLTVDRGQPWQSAGTLPPPSAQAFTFVVPPVPGGDAPKPAVQQAVTRPEWL